MWKNGWLIALLSIGCAPGASEDTATRETPDRAASTARLVFTSCGAVDSICCNDGNSDCASWGMAFCGDWQGDSGSCGTLPDESEASRE